LEKYLGSGLIKGVGPKTAQKIVRHFADRTLDVFENQIDDLLDVRGIAQKKLDAIKCSWKQHRAIRELLAISNDPLIREVLGQLLERNEIKKRILPREEGSSTECHYPNSLCFDEAYVAKKIARLNAIQIAVDRARISSWIEKRL
jgi:5'-3' exonuclease